MKKSVPASFALRACGFLSFYLTGKRGSGNTRSYALYEISVHFHCNKLNGEFACLFISSVILLLFILSTKALHFTNTTQPNILPRCKFEHSQHQRATSFLISDKGFLKNLNSDTNHAKRSIGLDTRLQ